MTGAYPDGVTPYDQDDPYELDLREALGDGGPAGDPPASHPGDTLEADARIWWCTVCQSEGDFDDLRANTAAVLRDYGVRLRTRQCACCFSEEAERELATELSAMGLPTATDRAEEAAFHVE